MAGESWSKDLRKFGVRNTAHYSAVSRMSFPASSFFQFHLHSLLSFYPPCFHKTLKFFGTSIAPFDSETVELPAFSIPSAMFTGACGPPEKLSLALVPRSNVLRMIVKLAYYKDPTM